MDHEFLINHIEYILLKTEYVAAGLFIIYLGYQLFIKGVAGEASLLVEFEKNKAQLLNAAPGIFFVICGVVVLGYAITQPLA